MKFMNKIFNISLIIVLLSVSFFVNPIRVEAKTLRSLKEEYEKIKQEYEDNKRKQQLTNDEINKINNNVALIQKNIEEGQQEIIKLNDENVELQLKMDEKDKEIKKILNFLQISEGENVYLEYAFGAKTFTDFIYRMAVTEQLSNYNDKLIKEYNELIEENKRNLEAIEKKNAELQQKQEQLRNELAKLKNQINTLYEDAIDVSEALKQQDAIIKMYENDYHCNLDDDLSSCAANALPSDTTFWRPTNNGYISSNYGMRWHPTQGIYKLHDGIDIAMGEGTPVYAMAAGTVVTMWRQYYCGGNMVWIMHRVNGQYYTTAYEHLLSINVNIGDVVTKDTVIGYSGGGPGTWGWETCSTGGHLHISVMYGRAGLDYVLYSNTYYSKLIDPRQVVNLPGLYGSYSNRTSRY